MVNMEIEYPQFRKYPNNKSFFKVFSAEEFEEIQIIGKNYLKVRIKAKILPDRIFIADMLAAHDNWLKIDRNEYNEVEEREALNNKN